MPTIHKVPRVTRHTLWLRAENLAVDILELIMETPFVQKQEKITHLRRISRKIDLIKVFVRLSHETQAIDLKTYQAIETAAEHVGNMIGGSIKSASS